MIIVLSLSIARRVDSSKSKRVSVTNEVVGEHRLVVLLRLVLRLQAGRHHGR